jgi:SAM-dependent methyltransferase
MIMNGRTAGPHAEAGAVQAQVSQTLDSLRDDVSLVSPAVAQWWTGYLRKSADRYLEILSFLDEDDRGARVLEIGSFPGHFTVVLKRLGYDVAGVDLDPARGGAFWDKHGLDVRRTDVEQEPLPFPDGSFDVVLFTETIEHLRLNPLHALREIARVLRPGGRMILSTNNITPVHRFQFVVHGRAQSHALEAFQKLEQLGHMGHFRIYNFEELRDFCRHVGLRLTRREYEGHLVGGRMARAVAGILPQRLSRHFRHSIYLVAEKPAA